jgi:spermidine/putrescine-binding protein
LAAHAQERKVNFYNWSNYMAPGVLEDFTKETGIKVIYDTFDANETLETRLLAGQSGYDLVVPGAYFLERQIKANVFQKLDKSKLPNLVNAWPELSQKLAVYDPGNQYGVNYMWGTTGVGYNVKKAREVLGPNVNLDEAMSTLDIVFKPENLSKFKDCGVHMLDSADDILPAALTYLKLDPNSSKQADLDKAVEVIAKIRPFVQIPLVRISGRAGRWRNLLRVRLVRRHQAGAEPGGRGQERRRDRLRHPEGGRADVLRQSRDPRGREECGGSLRADRLSLPPGDRREELRFPVLRER